MLTYFPRQTNVYKNFLYQFIVNELALFFFHFYLI